MPDPNNVQTATTQQTEPDVAQAALAAKEQEFYFGNEMLDDGTVSPDATKTKTEEPGKKESTSDASPAGPAPDEKRKLAGKYETTEALEKGYSELQTLNTATKRERDEMERKMKVLEEQIGKAPATQPDGSTPPDASAGGPRLNPQVKAILDKAKEVGGDEVAEVFQDLLEYYDSKLGAPKGTTGEPAGDDLAETTLKHFKEQFPEYADGDQATAFGAYLDKVSKSIDPMEQLDLVRRAFEHQSESARLDTAVKSAVDKAVKEAVDARDKHWKAVIGSNNVSFAATGPGDSNGPDLKKQEQIHYFGANNVDS